MKALLCRGGSARPRPSHLWVVDLDSGRGSAEGAVHSCVRIPSSGGGQGPPHPSYLGLRGGALWAL